MNFGLLPDPDPERALREALGIETLRVRSEATSLGFIISAKVSEKLWESAVRKFLERVAFVRRVPRHTGDRIVAYTTLAFSTLRCRADVHAPSSAALRAEAVALSSVFVAPMYSLHPDLLAGLALLGSRRRVPSLRVASEVSQSRVGSSHPRIAMHIEALDSARWQDHALLEWRALGWVRRSPLALMRMD